MDATFLFTHSEPKVELSVIGPRFSSPARVMSPIYTLFVRTFTWQNLIYVTLFCVMCGIVPGFQWKLLDGRSVLNGT